jgi:hypothetical protein
LAAQGLQPFALQGLQPRLAAQGLHFLAAQGLQPRLAPQGLQPFALQGLQLANWTGASTELAAEAAIGSAAVPAASAATLTLMRVFLNIGSLPNLYQAT